jgi:hypothetical protein
MGGRYDPQQTPRCSKPVKQIGKYKAQEVCEAKGFQYRYDPQTGACVKSAGKVKTCEAKGPNYRYDEKTGSCIKSIAKAKPGRCSGTG